MTWPEAVVAIVFLVFCGWLVWVAHKATEND